MNVEKELVESKNLLFTIPGNSYQSTSLDIIKQLANKKVAYVSLNKTYSSLIDYLKKENIDSSNFKFLDGISKTIRLIKENEPSLFVSYPGALGEIELEIMKLLTTGAEILVFDSITSLSIYQDDNAIEQFLSKLISRITELKKKSIFFIVKTENQQGLIDESSVFFDKVIDTNLI